MKRSILALLAVLYLSPARADIVIVVTPSADSYYRPYAVTPGYGHYEGRQHYRRQHRSHDHGQHHLDALRAAERARQHAEWRRAVEEKSRASRWMMHGSTP